MKTILRFSHLSILVISVIFLSSCGGGSQQEQESTTDTAAVTTAPEPTAPSYDATKIDPNAPVTEIALDAVGATMTDMKYSLPDIHAKAGTTVKITFKNKGVGDAMQHNFVIVYSGKREAVATAGIKAGLDNSYVEPGSADVLVTSKVLKPGESEVITFPAPPAGQYEFVCTYPGHWMSMHGTFVVE